MGVTSINSVLRRAVEITRQEWIFFILLIIVFILSAYHLSEMPPTWYDEGMILQLAINLVHHGSMSTQISPDTFVSGAYTSTGFPVVAPVALSFLIFGISLTAARWVMVVYMLLFFTTAYFLLNRIVGKTWALISCAFLASFSSLYGDGKNVLGEVPGLFFLLGFLFFAYKIFDEGRDSKKNIILAGLSFGLCVSTKPSFLLLVGAVAVGLVCHYFYKRTIPPLKVFIYGACAASVPIIIWVLTQFNIHDSAANIAAFYANPYRLEYIGSVMSQNFSRFFTEATPIYLLFLMAAWIASIVIRIWRKGGISFVEATAFSFACLTLLAYLRTPGWYRYFFPAQILATLFFSVSVKNIIKNSPIRARFLVRYIAMGMFALLIGLQTYLLFFDSWISQYAESTKTEQWEEYFAEMDPTLTVFVYDMPEAVPFLPVRTTYYQYVAVNAQGYWGLGTNELEVIKKKIPDEILISKDSPALPLAGYYQSNEVAGIAVLMRQAE